MKKLLFILQLIAISTPAYSQWWGGGAATSSPSGCMNYGSTPTFCWNVTDQATGCYAAQKANTGQTISLGYSTPAKTQLVYSSESGASLLRAIRCAADRFRIDSSLGIVQDDQTSNYLYPENDFSGWTTTNTTFTASAAVGPDGSTNAPSLQSSVNGGYIEGNTFVGGANAIQYGAWVRTLTGTQSFSLQIWDTVTQAGIGTLTFTATTDWQFYTSYSTIGVSGHNETYRVYPGSTSGLGTILISDAFAGYRNTYYNIATFGIPVTSGNTGLFPNMDAYYTSSNPWSYNSSWSASGDISMSTASRNSSGSYYWFASQNSSGILNQTQISYNGNSGNYVVRGTNGVGTATTCYFTINSGGTGYTAPGFSSGSIHLRVTWDNSTNLITVWENGIRKATPCVFTNHPVATPTNLYIMWDGASSQSESWNGWGRNFCYDTTLNGCK